MTFSMWRAAALVTVAALASACADEDLEGANAASPRSITVSGIGANAPSVTRVRVTPSTGQERADAVPVFYRVRAELGDTVAVVSERFRVRPEYVIWNNEGAFRDGELIEGAILDIPSANGILHRPQLGETLTDIAARHGVELQSLLDYPPNGLVAAPSIPLPSVILVPEARKP